MVDGGTVVLPCSTNMTGPNVKVTWYRMSDGIEVTHNRYVVHNLQDRITVEGAEGHYNLKISPVMFPEDHGAWRCAVFNSTEAVQETNLNVTAPPATHQPILTPGIGLIREMSPEGYMYTCSAPPASPPVQLRWEERPRPQTVDEIERLVVDGIMDSEGITAMLTMMTASLPNNGAMPQTGQQPAYSKNVNGPSGEY